MKKIFLKLVFFYSSIVVLISMILYIIVINNSPNIIVLNYNIPFKNSMNALAPQGWAFFTKDVKKDYFKIYELHNKNQPITIKTSTASQFFGLIRDNRVINSRISTIINNVNSKLWFSFKGDINKIPKDSLSKVSIKVKKPMIFGNFIIEKGIPLPYDWYKSKLHMQRTMEYVEIEIKQN